MRREAEAALSKPARDAAEALARSLRSMLALVPDAGGPGLDALLGECDARSYAPAPATSEPLPEEFQERARHLVAALEQAGQ
jgi:hypothetical protein